MKLLMYIGNDLIDSICVDRKKIVYPGYIGNLIRMLKAKYDGLIQLSCPEPEFFLHDSQPIIVDKKRESELY